MNRSHLKAWVLTGTTLGALLFAQPIAAQVIPDRTLPATERSLVTGNPNFQIDGGARRGGNLFHSFSQFSIPTGGSAYFNNAPTIANIFTRVTGGSISNIDGVIRANGTANLFLLNPNGILFGLNASLNIGGSFVGTTANVIGFGNLGFFSASNPEAPSPLLTINPSALLFNQIAAAPIQNSSIAPAGTTLAGEDALGLRVPNGRSLLLVGGNISMDGGQLNAFGGRVELGGLASAGTVGLNADGNNLSLSFPDSVERSDVFLSNGAQVNVFASDGGSIAVNARNLEMTEGSVLGAGIDSGLGSNNSKAGNISVNATGAIDLNYSLIANEVQRKAKGQGGDISISANTLRLEGGAQVDAATLGVGKGGSLRVDAQDVQIIGRSANGQVSSSLGADADPNSTGNAGNLTIRTNTLVLRDGGEVSSSTFGAGKGGSLSVDAQDVQLIGLSADGRAASGLFASAEPNSTGDAGNLTIKTNTLVVRDGARVNAFTFSPGKGGSVSVDAQDVQLIGRSANGQVASGLFASAAPNSTGNAGDLTIKTNTLLVRDGAQVGAATFAAGKGGSLRVDAQDVQLIGLSADGKAPSGLLADAEPNSTGDAGNLTIKTNTLLVRDGAQVRTSTVGTGKGGDLIVDAQDVQIIGTIANPRFASALIAGAENSTGDAGNLTIKTNTLLVRDAAGITVENFGTGTAGNMTLNARSIRLDNNGLISANTRSAKVAQNREQATININSQNLILTGNSNIITNATGANVLGGNININADVLVGIENSNITANSADFRGGNVSINTQGIFGIQPRPFLTPLSDITATGASSAFNGTVQLNIERVDPASGLGQLPATVVDSSRLIARGCPATQGNSFVTTGRGGLPPTPEQQLDDDADWQDRRQLVVARQQTAPTTHNSTTHSRQPTAHNPIIEATGWQMTLTGKVMLVATISNPMVHNPLNQPVACQGRH